MEKRNRFQAQLAGNFQKLQRCVTMKGPQGFVTQNNLEISNLTRFLKVCSEILRRFLGEIFERFWESFLIDFGRAF